MPVWRQALLSKVRVARGGWALAALAAAALGPGGAAGARPARQREASQAAAWAALAGGHARDGQLGNASREALQQRAAGAAARAVGGLGAAIGAPAAEPLGTAGAAGAAGVGEARPAAGGAASSAGAAPRAGGGAPGQPPGPSPEDAKPGHPSAAAGAGAGAAAGTAAGGDLVPSSGVLRTLWSRVVGGAEDVAAAAAPAAATTLQAAAVSARKRADREWREAWEHFAISNARNVKTSNAALASEGWVMATLSGLVGGTGAAVGGTGSLRLDRDLARRMRMQDQAVLVLLMGIYVVTLLCCASLVYHEVKNDAPVTFYADPRYSSASVDGFELNSFLNAFNDPPERVYLRVTGYTPTPHDAPGSLAWRGGSYRISFTFALDLSHLVKRATLESIERERGRGDFPCSDVLHWREDGIAADDLDALSKLLAAGPDRNEMCIVEMRKAIVWANWEDLAMNIKSKIRQQGFTGHVWVDRDEGGEVSVFRNTQWANFMHSKSFKVLVFMSVFGWMFYYPYMLLACKKTRVRAVHRVDIPIGDYWDLISEQLCSRGFEARSEFFSFRGLSQAIAQAVGSVDRGGHPRPGAAAPGSEDARRLSG